MESSIFPILPKGRLLNEDFPPNKLDFYCGFDSTVYFGGRLTSMVGFLFSTRTPGLFVFKREVFF